MVLSSAASSSVFYGCCVGARWGLGKGRSRDGTGGSVWVVGGGSEGTGGAVLVPGGKAVGRLRAALCALRAAAATTDAAGR